MLFCPYNQPSKRSEVRCRLKTKWKITVEGTLNQVEVLRGEKWDRAYITVEYITVINAFDTHRETDSKRRQILGTKL